MTEASKRGFSTIAFPAIGTGNLGYPRDIVARVFFEEVDAFQRNNPQASVLEVRFVLFHTDAPTIQAFENEQKNRCQKIGNPTLDGSFPTTKGIKINMIKGDLSDEKVSPKL